MTELRRKYEDTDAITWLQVHNLLPVIAGIIAIASVFYLLQNKVELLNQREAFLESRLEAQQVSINDIQTKVNSQSLDIKALQVEGGSVKGASIFKSSSTKP